LHPTRHDRLPVAERRPDFLHAGRAGSRHGAFAGTLTARLTDVGTFALTALTLPGVTFTNEVTPLGGEQPSGVGESLRHEQAQDDGEGSF
jgi:hypothetical protein